MNTSPRTPVSHTSAPISIPCVIGCSEYGGSGRDGIGWSSAGPSAASLDGGGWFCCVFDNRGNLLMSIGIASRDVAITRPFNILLYRPFCDEAKGQGSRAAGGDP